MARHDRLMVSRRISQFSYPTGTDLLALPRAGHDVAELQSGVMARSQLRALGCTLSQVRAQTSARRWRTFGRNVVVLSNAPLTQQQREWVAVLLPGKPTALAGLSAALRGFEPDQVHIVVRHATHAKFPRWVKIHESRRFDESDILQASAPARTSTGRALIDAATWSPWPRRACAILCAGVQQRLVTAEHLLRELRIARRVRHAAIMRDILGDIGGGGHTLAEIELGPLAMRVGLPPPRRQALRREASGKVRWLDAEFDLPDGTVLCVEVDGGVHQQTETWWNDLDRQNEIVIGRRPILRYPSLVLRAAPERVEDQLRRMRMAYSIAA